MERKNFRLILSSKLGVAPLAIAGAALFVLYHALIVSPLFIPIFRNLGIDILRAPAMEELFKVLWAVALISCFPLLVGRPLRVVIIVGVSAGLGETLINATVAYNAMMDTLKASLPSGEDVRLAYAAGYVAILVKCVIATVGHSIPVAFSLRFLKERRYALAFAAQFLIHLAINVSILFV